MRWVVHVFEDEWFLASTEELIRPFPKFWHLPAAPGHRNYECLDVFPLAQALNANDYYSAAGDSEMVSKSAATLQDIQDVGRHIIWDASPGTPLYTRKRFLPQDLSP